MGDVAVGWNFGVVDAVGNVWCFRFCVGVDQNDFVMYSHSVDGHNSGPLGRHEQGYRVNGVNVGRNGMTGVA